MVARGCSACTAAAASRPGGRTPASGVGAERRHRHQPAPDAAPGRRSTGRPARATTGAPSSSATPPLPCAVVERDLDQRRRAAARPAPLRPTARRPAGRGRPTRRRRRRRRPSGPCWSAAGRRSATRTSRSTRLAPCSRASWSRFSAKSRTPSAASASTSPAGWVLVTATSVTSSAGRPAAWQAASIRARTRSRLALELVRAGSRLQPDDTGEPAGHPVPAVREEVGVSTVHRRSLLTSATPAAASWAATPAGQVEGRATGTGRRQRCPAPPRRPRRPWLRAPRSTRHRPTGRSPPGRRWPRRRASPRRPAPTMPAATPLRPACTAPTTPRLGVGQQHRHAVGDQDHQRRSPAAVVTMASPSRRPPRVLTVPTWWSTTVTHGVAVHLVHVAAAGPRASPIGRPASRTRLAYAAVPVVVDVVGRG